MAAPLTGDMGTEGQGLLRAVELAVEQVNAAKRFPFLLEAAPYDDRADPKEAVNVADLIVSDARVIAVIGHYNSGCALAAAPIYAQAGMPMITPSATNPQVTLQQLAPGWPGPRVVFRVVPTDDVEGAYAGDFAFRRLRKRRIALMHDGTPYGRGLALEFKSAFVKSGGKILSEDAISPGDKDFRALLSHIKAERPDALYFGGVYTEAGLIVRQMREVGMDAAFLSGDGAKTPSLFDVAGTAADGAYLTVVGTPVELLPAAKSFVAAYRQRWPGADEGLKPFDPMGYEAAQVLFDALAKAGPDRPKLLEALRLTRRDGILGPMSFDDKGDTLNKTVTMVRADAKDRSFAAVH